MKSIESLIQTPTLYLIRDEKKYLFLEFQKGLELFKLVKSNYINQE